MNHITSNLQLKIKYYLLDIPYCAKSALVNSIRIVLFFSLLGFLIFLVRGETSKDAISIVFEFVYESSARLFILFFLLITFLRFYSKFIYWNKNYDANCNVTDLHNKWKNQ